MCINGHARCDDRLSGRQDQGLCRGRLPLVSRFSKPDPTRPRAVACNTHVLVQYEYSASTYLYCTRTGCCGTVADRAPSVFDTFSAIGFDCLAFLLPVELTPLRTRAKSVSIATGCFWLCSRFFQQ